MKYKQIKKIGGRFFKNLPQVEGFSTFHPIFFYLLKKIKKNVWKSLNILGAIFLDSIFEKKTTHTKKNVFYLYT